MYEQGSLKPSDRDVNDGVIPTFGLVDDGAQAGESLVDSNDAPAFPGTQANWGDPAVASPESPEAGEPESDPSLARPASRFRRFRTIATWPRRVIAGAPRPRWLRSRRTVLPSEEVVDQAPTYREEGLTDPAGSDEHPLDPTAPGRRRPRFIRLRSRQARIGLAAMLSCSILVAVLIHRKWTGDVVTAVDDSPALEAPNSPGGNPGEAAPRLEIGTQTAARPVADLEDQPAAGITPAPDSASEDVAGVTPPLPPGFLETPPNSGAPVQLASVEPDALIVPPQPTAGEPFELPLPEQVAAPRPDGSDALAISGLDMATEAIHAPFPQAGGPGTAPVDAIPNLDAMASSTLGADLASQPDALPVDLAPGQENLAGAGSPPTAIGANDSAMLLADSQGTNAAPESLDEPPSMQAELPAFNALHEVGDPIDAAPPGVEGPGGESANVEIPPATPAGFPANLLEHPPAGEAAHDSTQQAPAQPDINLAENPGLGGAPGRVAQPDPSGGAQMAPSGNDSVELGPSASPVLPNLSAPPELDAAGASGSKASTREAVKESTLTPLPNRGRFESSTPRPIERSRPIETVPFSSQLGPASERETVGPTTVTPESLPHVVQSGENFFTISRLYYGSGRYWKALWSANREQYPEPTDLFVGATIKVPPPELLEGPIAAVDEPMPGGEVSADPARGSTRDEGIRRTQEESAALVSLPLASAKDRAPTAKLITTEPVQAPQPTYVVRGTHETLRSVARETLGDSRRAEEIRRLNLDLIESAGQLQPGMKLRLPNDAQLTRP